MWLSSSSYETTFTKVVQNIFEVSYHSWSHQIDGSILFRFRPSRHWKQLYFTSTIASIILPANPLFSISWKLSRSFFFPSSAFGCLQREFYILNFRILWFIQTDFNQYVSSPPETVLDCVININFFSVVEIFSRIHLSLFNYK